VQQLLLERLHCCLANNRAQLDVDDGDGSKERQMRHPLVPRTRVLVNCHVRGVDHCNIGKRWQASRLSDMMQHHARVDWLHEHQAAIARLRSRDEMRAPKATHQPSRTCAKTKRIVSFSRADAQERKLSGVISAADAAVADDDVGDEGEDGNAGEGNNGAEGADVSSREDVDVTEGHAAARGGNADFIRLSRAAAAAAAATEASTASTDAEPSLPLVKRYLLLM
jgi:hypothetical protein